MRSIKKTLLPFRNVCVFTDNLSSWETWFPIENFRAKGGTGSFQSDEELYSA